MRTVCGTILPLGKKLEDALAWYDSNKDTYEELCKRVENILKEVLDANGVNYHSVTSRLKSRESYRKKASQVKYSDPITQIMDVAGVRVITYTEADAKNVEKIVKDAFDINPSYTVDKAKELGVNKVGYRSIHCVGTLGSDRLQLPENEIFQNTCFEIQIRTILQHSWAEFEHDRNYKFKGILPGSLGRRLKILAGTLELVDREFDSIAKEIDTYSRTVEEKTELGDLSIPLNSTSLTTFLKKRFKSLVDSGWQSSEIGKVAIEELHIMGIKTLHDLDIIIPHNFAEKESKHKPRDSPGTFLGLLRDIMIIHDPNKYFTKAWKRRWAAMDRSFVPLCKEYKVNIKKYIKEYDLGVL